MTILTFEIFAPYKEAYVFIMGHIDKKCYSYQTINACRLLACIKKQIK